LKSEILTYYNTLAKDYDQDRFNNTYGKYIHTQESKILKKYLDPNYIETTLDLACGTGRFLDYAKYGSDISEEMIKIGRKKFPDRILEIADAENLPFKNNTFESIISFHLFMHLNSKALKNILKEVSRICKTGGQFIFDIPSKNRRKLLGYKSSSWHGGYQISKTELEKMIGNDWSIETFHGVAFFPIHRIPKKLRFLCIKLDTILCNSFFKSYSSHLIFVLKRK